MDVFVRSCEIEGEGLLGRTPADEGWSIETAHLEPPKSGGHSDESPMPEYGSTGTPARAVVRRADASSKRCGHTCTIR